MEQPTISTPKSELTTATTGLRLGFVRPSIDTNDPLSTSGVFSVRQSISVVDEETLEKEVMKKEKQWLLSYEIPFVCEEVRKLLEQCLSVLNPLAVSPPSNPTGFSSSTNVAAPDSQLISFESPDGFIKGSVRLDGWNVNEAEIHLKSTKNLKGSPFRTSVSIGNPFKLSQIYDCFNLIKLVLRSLNELKSLSSISSDTNEIARNINQISDSIRSATDELQFPSKELFPKFTPSLACFQPPLPPEFVIYFSINKKELTVSAYCIHQVNSRPSTTQLHNNNSPVGQIYQYKRNGTKQMVEVTDYANLGYALPKLQQANEIIMQAYNLMAELKDKIILFP